MARPGLGIKFSRGLKDLGLTRADLPEIARRLKEAGFELKEGSFAQQVNGEYRWQATLRLGAQLVQEKHDHNSHNLSTEQKEEPPAIAFCLPLTVTINIDIQQLKDILGALGLDVSSPHRSNKS